MTPHAVILGCAGPTLGDEERRFFAAAQPLGFILFQRNCETPAQLRALTEALRDAVGRADAPVLIDQEGGRVARLKGPHWRTPPASRAFAVLYRRDPAGAIDAARLNARLIGAELAQLGIDVDCAPVLDLPVPGAHDVIGDRAYGATPESIIALGRAMCEGLLDEGVLPVIKHIPGHGRARADSHMELPVVDADRALLERSDFVPFRALNRMPWAMTAHVLYCALDPERAVTVSPDVIAHVIRGSIGFEGVLLSDDVSMLALAGTLAQRTAAVLAAGCDLALHCSGDPAEMRMIADAAGPLSEAATGRIARALAMKRRAQPFDRQDAARRLDALLAQPVA